MKGSPAEKAGIKQGDVILEYNGKVVEDTGHLRNMVSQTPKGTKVAVKVLRKKKEMTVEAVIAELPKKLSEPGAEEETGEGPEESNALSGVTVRELSPDLAKRFGLGEGESGVVVTRIDPGSKAAEAGVRPGDMILQINQQDIAGLDDYRAAVEKLKSDERILLLIRRKSQDLFLTIRPE
jgi:serine protease Do